MVSAVKSQPNHYELLGIKPGAASDAIAQAFARATSVFRPHVFGGITELCIAYETLRDPARRRAYDASIGIKPAPPRLVSRQVSAHFMALPAVNAPSLPEPYVEPRASEPEVVSQPPEPPAQRRPVQLDAPASPSPVYDEVGLGYSPIDWKRTGTIVGILAAVAIFIGAMAGWWSGSSAAEPDQVLPAAAPPKEKAPPSFSELWTDPAPYAVRTRSDRAGRTNPVPARADRRQLAASEAEAQLIKPPQDVIEPVSADPLAPEEVTAPAVKASMPLPHSTVARTLDRIGYRCGSVASATPVEGASGIYKVTCSSGQSFQAKPVNGRYRFRRLR